MLIKADNIVIYVHPELLFLQLKTDALVDTIKCAVLKDTGY